MEYTTLGSTGTTVSEICLGCMSFGDSDWREWVLNEEEGRELVERAIELGVNFFDTANMYSNGASERVLGEALDEYDRDEFVVATKGYFQMDESNPNSGGLSRKAIEQELSNSLDRLGTDTIDLYQIHRWDDETPIEETLAALDDAVRRGDVRYVGASSMWAHQFAEALHTSDREGYERFATMQNHYNLAYREEEREMLPLCEKEGVGVMPWSPLARGYLTRPHEEVDATLRGETEEHLYAHPYREGGGREVNERVEELAAERDVKMAQIALAWLFHKDWVDTPIVGTTSVEHLEDAVEALEIDLSASDLDWLEEPYEPVPVSGHE
jgi:aryl-alcohol dehydrogenase-like predicted oxidoreductase